jgi:hypothetical protein
LHQQLGSAVTTGEAIHVFVNFQFAAAALAFERDELIGHYLSPFY